MGTGEERGTPWRPRHKQQGLFPRPASPLPLPVAQRGASRRARWEATGVLRALCSPAKGAGRRSGRGRGRASVPAGGASARLCALTKPGRWLRWVSGPGLRGRAGQRRDLSAPFLRGTSFSPPPASAPGAGRASGRGRGPGHEPGRGAAAFAAPTLWPEAPLAAGKRRRLRSPALGRGRGARRGRKAPPRLVAGPTPLSQLGLRGPVPRVSSRFTLFFPARSAQLSAAGSPGLGARALFWGSRALGLGGLARLGAGTSRSPVVGCGGFGHLPPLAWVPQHLAARWVPCLSGPEVDVSPPARLPTAGTHLPADTARGTDGAP